MNINTSLKTAVPQAKRSVPAAGQQQKGPIALDSFKTGIQEEMQKPMPFSAAVKSSGSSLLEELNNVSGQNTAEAKANLSSALETAQSREKIAKYVSFGSMAGLIGGAALVIANTNPADGLGTLAKVAGAASALMIGAAGAETYFGSQAESIESTVNKLDNWESFLQNKAQVPAQPNMGSAIEMEAFQAAIEKHSQAPHPCPEVRDQGTKAALESVENHYTADSQSLLKEIAQEKEDARVDANWSVGESVVGVGLLAGGLVAGAAGVVPPVAALGMIVASPFLVADGVDKQEKFTQKGLDIAFEQSAVQDWNDYLAGSSEAK